MEKCQNLFREFESHGIHYLVRPNLANYTTFRLGGSCPYIVFCKTPEEMALVTRTFGTHDTDFLTIGEGSNLLISDSGLNIPLIRYVNPSPSIEQVVDSLKVTANTPLDKLVKYAVERGIEGFVNCSGIPGTVGGAISGNAGAFGWQMSDALERLTLIDKSGYKSIKESSEIGFSYRNSGLRNGSGVILDAQFAIQREDPSILRQRRREILELRASKHPDLRFIATAGSFFKNIEPSSAAEKRQAAGWFLEEVGAKEMRVGGAGLFEKHANIIIRKDKTCKANDIFNLSLKMADAVKTRFGIELDREVRLLGKFDHVQE